MSFIKRSLLSVGLFVLLTSVTVLAVRGFAYVSDFIADFRRYDYEAKRTAGFDWTGPRPGEIIDITSLVDRSGVPLSSLPRNDLILLTIVSPGCQATAQSREQIALLDEKMEAESVDRYIACFSPRSTSPGLKKYVESLNLRTSTLNWKKGLDSVLPSINTIVYPSHVLIDSNGVVIKSFPGTSSERKIRERMIRRVIEEVLAERDIRRST